MVRTATCHAIAQSPENKAGVAEPATIVMKKVTCQETVLSRKTRIIGVVEEVAAEAVTSDLQAFQGMMHLWMTLVEQEDGHLKPTLMLVMPGAHLELLTGTTQVVPQNLPELLVVVGVNLKHQKKMQILQAMIGMLPNPVPISHLGQTLGRMWLLNLQ